MMLTLRFQSTPPVKAATPNLGTANLDALISIHAAREGGDAVFFQPFQAQLYFNPRRP